jgi:hypothetical protein
VHGEGIDAPCATVELLFVVAGTEMHDAGRVRILTGPSSSKRTPREREASGHLGRPRNETIMELRVLDDKREGEITSRSKDGAVRESSTASRRSCPEDVNVRAQMGDRTSLWIASNSRASL